MATDIYWKNPLRVELRCGGGQESRPPNSIEEDFGTGTNLSVPDFRRAAFGQVLSECDETRASDVPLPVKSAKG
jgi:hypothetical protein